MTATDALNNDDLAEMGRVLKVEADALSLMAGSLGEAHREAIAILRAVTGRVIVSGVGKSGHIARKIAATFASTGTPAQFVHPTEASHGDLGMITKADACIVISNSGETTELADLVTYAGRFAIPLIAITRRPESTLGSAADIVLPLPDAAEACPMGIAPTTSTTATLALGDALAVALMQGRGFGKADFQVFHPGGKLGAQLLRVEALMTPASDLPLVTADAPMREALVAMSGKGFGVLGMTEDGTVAGRLTGIITDGDLRRHLETLFDSTVGDVATTSPKTIDAGALASEAVHLMNEKKITALFVVDAEMHPLGLLRLHDCLRAGVA
ncbi:SIS domain-containing protein [Maritimibacter alkaliphilus]|uniref:KpsF/GutQ family sugar-phosphate isomerase n=1 Tax=Maritimibacter alkaliphilus TaxID=404236 RepID=UPI001C96087C|nr:KpsF/GutQ family sugar-phosphate isomerase [Maritimibacter alkaliphilus]MBY6093115.1 KpsF/GutQ family sugar-phosphate isomerase [Maritimibacter alkaliphilus]